jgi:putative ABC transport system permease protein
MLGDKLGFRKDHVIVINNAFWLKKNTQVFKNELINMPGVSSVSKASAIPGNQNFFGVTYQVAGSKKPITGRGIIVDENYAKLLNIEIERGRFFSKDFPSDTLGVVLNEKAVTELGLKDPIGQRLISPDLNKPDGTPVVYTVVGVVHDFHYQSLHQKITPLIFNYQPEAAASNLIALRVNSDNFQSVVNQVESNWNHYVKEQPFHYSFLDQNVAEQYLSEQTTQKLFTIFSALAIFIACIGLMGLAAYSTQQRIREIGIRKILGASVSGIITMLSVDFLKLILWSVLLAFPLAWWGMHHWLQNFAYRVTLSWWIFILAGMLSVVIAMLTISFQAIRAALTNPVKSLRSE